MNDATRDNPFVMKQYIFIEDFLRSRIQFLKNVRFIFSGSIKRFPASLIEKELIYESRTSEIKAKIIDKTNTIK